MEETKNVHQKKLGYYFFLKKIYAKNKKMDLGRDGAGGERRHTAPPAAAAATCFRLRHARCGGVGAGRTTAGARGRGCARRPEMPGRIRPPAWRDLAAVGSPRRPTAWRRVRRRKLAAEAGLKTAGVILKGGGRGSSWRSLILPLSQIVSHSKNLGESKYFKFVKIYMTR